MQREDLTATSHFWARLTAVLVVGAAVLVFASAMSDSERDLYPKLPGIGGAVALGLLAHLWLENHRMRVRIAELMEAMNQLLYGRHYERDREAIEILIRTLETDPANAGAAHRHLQRLTGQHFAGDPAVWRSWWEVNRRTFERAHGAEAAEGPAARAAGPPRGERPPGPGGPGGEM